MSNTFKDTVQRDLIDGIDWSELRKQQDVLAEILEPLRASVVPAAVVLQAFGPTDETEEALEGILSLLGELRDAFGPKVEKAACPKCGSHEDLAFIERVIGSCPGEILRAGPDAIPDFEGFGETRMDWDSTESIGIECTRCGWSVETEDATGAVAWVEVDHTEPWCNHDDAAVVDGVCECGHR